MAYSKNPHLPKVRGEAVELVRRGWSVRKVARHFGYTHSAVVKWCAKAKVRGYGSIPTHSSRPKTSPQALSREKVGAIIEKRVGNRRCGQVIHQELLRDGIVVSLSSVQRTLERCHLTKKRSPWKRPHDATPRPEVSRVGALVELDTIHIMLPDGSRLYVYTLIDLYSRWAYAEVSERISAERSVKFLRRAQKIAPFRFEMIQTDHGPEFSTWFTHGVWRLGMQHRHSRVRQSNDQAHVERFNRTIQEECLDRIENSFASFRKEIPLYLSYYNTKRLHMGINYQTPLELVPRS